MKWYFLNTGFGSGSFNMEFDKALADTCASDQAFFRLYRWQPYCLSLGMYQNESDVNRELIEREGIEIVKRPTGGRAVLHSEELTYSVIFPLNSEFTPQVIYRQINEALQAGLAMYDERLSMSSLEKVQPDFRKVYQSDNGMACFAASAKNELKLDHKKLVGSAQRKIGNIILQHGSILCGGYHKRIISLLNIPEAMRQPLIDDINEKTIEIETVTGLPVDYEKLAECLKSGFEDFFSIRFLQPAFSALQKIHSDYELKGVS